MRTTTKAMQFIEAQAQHFDLNTKQLYNKTKSLLGLYRNVVWSVKNRAADYRKEIAGTYGMQLNTRGFCSNSGIIEENYFHDYSDTRAENRL